MSNENSGCGKTIAILGVVASIIAIFTFLTGIVSIKDFTRTSHQPANNLPPTPYYQQVDTVTLPFTDTPQSIPTDTSVPTPIPTETPLPDTPPGTILDVGQTWRQEGFELAMVQAVEWGYGMDKGLPPYSFNLTNLQPYDRSFRVYLENFSAIDNRGVKVQAIPDYQNVIVYNNCTPGTVVVPANSTVRLESFLECSTNWGPRNPDVLRFVVDLGDTAINEVIVSVSVGSINNARWRIEIHH
jgi:hypothetical protein